MISISSFRKIANEKGLYEISQNMYMKKDSNINFILTEETIEMVGIIPMNLATILYDYFKELDNDNKTNSHITFEDDMLVHPNYVINHTKLVRENVETMVNVGSEEEYRLVRGMISQEVLLNDYDDCYLTNISIHNIGSFENVLDIVNLYSLEVNETKVLRK